MNKTSTGASCWFFDALISVRSCLEGRQTRFATDSCSAAVCGDAHLRQGAMQHTVSRPGVHTTFDGSISVLLLFLGCHVSQVAAMLICGTVQHWVLPFGVPAALLCEAILHANNMRDIEQDRKAGISTLATVRGDK